MEKYSSYKDSGVKWLGEIPSHWEVFRIRYNYYLKGRIGWQGLKADEFCEDGPYLVTGTDFLNGKVNWNTCYHISKERYDEAPEIHVKVGDLLMTKDGTVGKTAYIDQKPEKVSLNSHLLIIRPLKTNICHNRFLQYLINSDIFRSFTNVFSTGSIMSSISQEKFCDFRFPLPSFNEQDAIVSYLDTATSQIDTAISQQKKMIELLNERKQIIINNAVTKGLDPNVKMKDSGVDWIGEIPEGWEVISIKHIIKFINGYAFDSNKFKNEGEIPVIRIGDISEGKINLDDIVYVSRRKELDSYLTKQGDLLIAMSGATTGKVGFDSTGGKYINQRVGAIRSNNQKLVFYWLNSTYFKEYVLLSALGSAQPNISSNGISNFQICLPKEGDINSIVLYIEEEIGKIDQIVKVAQKQISLLQERKQIIINDVVTGKVKVS